MPRASIDYMNRARELHRSRGTSGGKGNARVLSGVELAHHAATRNPIRDIVWRAHYELGDAIEQFRHDINDDDWSALCPF